MTCKRRINLMELRNIDVRVNVYIHDNVHLSIVYICDGLNQIFADNWIKESICFLHVSAHFYCIETHTHQRISYLTTVTITFKY